MPQAGGGRTTTSGALVVRAWFEDETLRARVTSTTDVTTPDETVVLVAGAPALLEAVMSWVDAMEHARA
ncbi:MAG TPA: hypothetical protein VK894_08355 [Jiangellales bacterium]|nr:hypothetical protein [Jiangellales bacterium]